MTDEALRTVAEAARELSVSVGTVRAWIASRKLGHVKLGRSVRVPAGEVRRLIAEGSVAAAAEGGKG